MSALLISQPEYRALMLFDALPAGCISFMCADEHSMPHVRPGEFVVVDTADRAPRHGELYVIQWDNGRRVICQARKQTFRSRTRPDDPLWSVGSLKTIAGRAAIDRYIEQESARAQQTGHVVTLRGLGWTDGYFDTAHLTEKLVGCVVGLYAPRFEEPRRPS